MRASIGAHREAKKDAWLFLSAVTYFNVVSATWFCGEAAHPSA
jgi:hypothetical protein